ncbi:MAG: glucosaminidase domain-containing protein [Bacteroidales bacterium]|nr:glucosaminidase domain-containing protein [Bacteroidota bacterium]MBL6949897.1 glucosaminidase domain-containing protein [Bacteroidales bacterium]
MKQQHHYTNSPTHQFTNSSAHQFTILTIIFIFSTCLSFAQTSHELQVLNYIDKYKGIGIQHMTTYGIPASIKMAQAIIESRAGQSSLAREANNHFGIKCHKGWTGKTYRMDDDTRNECFRKYEYAVESFQDHSEFLITRNRYSFLFSLDIQDYQAWAYGLKSAGYATNPKYPDLLIRVIEKYSLNQYDLPERAVAAVATTKADEDLLEAFKSLFTYFGPGPDKRKIYLNNHVQCTFALKDDDLLRIARDFHVKASELMKFNDLKRAGGIKEGQVIYLQKKKRRAVQKVHVVGFNQTMWEISQVYAIRLKSLNKKNNLPAGFEPAAGKMLKLR